MSDKNKLMPRQQTWFWRTLLGWHFLCSHLKRHYRTYADLLSDAPPSMANSASILHPTQTELSPASKTVFTLAPSISLHLFFSSSKDVLFFFAESVAMRVKMAGVFLSLCQNVTWCVKPNFAAPSHGVPEEKKTVYAASQLRMMLSIDSSRNELKF